MTETTKEIKRTITSIFMVPTLKIPKGHLIENGFINAYSKDDMRDTQYENAIYLLFKPKQLDMFREFLDSEYERTKDVIDDYDYPNGFVVVVYKLNMSLKHDYELIKKGMYSKTSPSFQSEFPRVIKIKFGSEERKEISLQYRVFNKTEDLIKFWEEKFDVRLDKDQELWDGFNEENETLTQETLKEYEQQ